ncbi:hypothetical protein ILYODFUR_032185 [Ilyodon furcidens]|uniref:Uncharacterized protein n=1 Tax=Ilyodon furcidens TaxID=33524 RepID=A0ABV0VKF7_9TELE
MMFPIIFYHCQSPDFQVQMKHTANVDTCQGDIAVNQSEKYFAFSAIYFLEILIFKLGNPKKSLEMQICLNSQFHFSSIFIQTSELELKAELHLQHGCKMQKRK